MIFSGYLKQPVSFKSVRIKQELLSVKAPGPTVVQYMLLELTWRRNVCLDKVFDKTI